MKRLYTTVASTLLALSLHTQAASIVTAERSFEQQNFEKALTELKPLVSEGDADALYLLGVMTRDGLGVSVDTEEAKRLFEAAARQGHLRSVNALRAIKNETYKLEFAKVQPEAEAGKAQAQNRLGEMYEFGQGVDRDLDSAFAWFGKAADQGLIAAVHNVARSHNFGSGTPVNYVVAEQLYLEAAQQGYADSMFFLGTLYATKNGNDDRIDPDLLAYAWMHAASARGNVTAGVIEKRLLMKLDEQGRKEAEQLAQTFVEKYVTPFK